MPVRFPSAFSPPGMGASGGPPAFDSGRAGYLRLADRIGDFWIVGVLCLLVVVGGVLTPDHELFTKGAWQSISGFSVEYLLLAIGQTFVILTGGIDLSDGAILGFTGMVSGAVMQGMLNSGASGLLTTIAGFAVALALGAFIGAVNGFLITWLKLPPFIVTLGSLTAIGAAPSLINGGTEVDTLPSQISSLGTGSLGGWIYTTFLVAVVATVAFGLVLHRTRFGLRTFAIGSNGLSARRAGINVDRHLVWVYTISGFLAGLAGMMVMANFDVANPLSGQGDELDAIAAVVIGGASLFGGRGNMLGTFVGTMIISLLVTLLPLLNINGSWTDVVTGIIIVAAVALDQVRLRLAER
ncbi:MAG TPA: ABC transporter permease [Acidimicrobiales bacterium]|nr:ABC transporter permease [Acidimicrobiales bacterium]